MFYIPSWWLEKASPVLAHVLQARRHRHLRHRRAQLPAYRRGGQDTEGAAEG